MPKDPVQKEVLGIVYGLLVIFLLLSLLSFSPEDPSLHHAGASGEIQNLFGFLGAHLAGFFIGLFGMGAFWIPLLLLADTWRLFRGRRLRPLALHLPGAVLLVLTTGALFAFQGPEFQLLGHRFLSGGMLGQPLKTLLVAYTNPAGGAIVLAALWLAGLLMATGLSLKAAAQQGACLAGRLREARAARRAAKAAPAAGAKRAVRAKKPAEPAADPPPAPPAAPPVPAGEDEIQIRIVAPKPPPAPPKTKGDGPLPAADGFRLPGADFLEDPTQRSEGVSDEHLRMQSQLLESKLEDFGVKGKVVAVTPGPVITTFEYAPAPGVKINKIVNLTDDLSLALRALSIRIVAPIPGKAAIGIEIPNAERETVRLKEIIQSGAFERCKSKLTLCLGKDIVGNPVAAELDRMPHLLIAGATGAGKSVALNAMICSLLYKATPEEVRLIMVDPKRIELSNYNGVPHLVTPVVTDAKKATNALYWAVREMEARYQLLSEKGARNITQYNLKVDKERKDLKGKADEAELPDKLPFIVIIIDELADLMMVASRDVEVALTRLAQMARAAGLHLVLATQRPSVDVLTGIIKANFPTRLTFQVSSKTDSRTIIDTNGAEKLLGNGDMLFLPPGTGRLQRIHGAYISEDELSRVIDFWKEQQPPDYDESVTEAAAEEKSANGEGEEYDEKYDEAVALVTKTRQASISMIQRHLRIGYNRAARIIETMEREGVVGPADGVNKREVLARGYDDMG